MRRRGQDFSIRTIRHIASCQVVEELSKVLADRIVAGEQSVVGVKSRRPRMIVAGPDMRVAAKPVVVLANHQDHFAMRLEADHSVSYMNPEFLEPGRQLGLRGFIKARFQLDDHCDLLAISCRIAEVAYNLRIARS